MLHYVSIGNMIGIACVHHTSKIGLLLSVSKCVRPKFPLDGRQWVVRKSWNPCHNQCKSEPLWLILRSCEMCNIWKIWSQKSIIAEMKTAAKSTQELQAMIMTTKSSVSINKLKQSGMLYVLESCYKTLFSDPCKYIVFVIYSF